MPQFSFAAPARNDLAHIARYTQEKWGAGQAEKYVVAILDTCKLLGERPTLGRITQEARQSRRRFEHQSHVIFYREVGGGILIQRILHKNMLPGRHLG